MNKQANHPWSVVYRLAIASGFVIVLLGLVVVLCFGWFFRQSADLDRLAEAVRPFGGSASVPEGGINFRNRTIDVELDLTGTNIDDESFAGLARMPAFRYVHQLVLERTRVTDKGLESLRDNSSIDLLNLSETRVADLGLKSVATMIPCLHTLYLRDTEVSDEGLEFLIAQRDHLRLSLIDLRNTKVTAAGVRSLSFSFDRIYIKHPAAN